MWGRTRPAAMGAGSGAGLTPRVTCDAGGAESVTLTAATTPAHSHPVNCLNAQGTLANPVGKFWAEDSGGNKVFSSAGGGNLAVAALGGVGGQPHTNMMPFQVLNFCMCTQGIFPSRN